MFGIGLVAVIIIILIGAIILWRRSRKHPSIEEDEDWYLRVILCKEDGVVQFMFWLSIFFLGVAILSFNRSWGDPLSWRTVLLIATAVGLVISYYFKVVLTLIFSLIGILVWWGAQALNWAGGDIRSIVILTGIILIALIFYVLGHYYEKEMKLKRFFIAYSVLGIVLVTAALFVLSSKVGFYALETATTGIGFWASWQISSSLALMVVVLIGAMIFVASKRLISGYEILVALLIAVLFGIIAFLPQQTMFLGRGSLFSAGELSSQGILWAVVFNLAIFLELLGLILSGYLKKEEWTINMGALFLFLLIIVKYFDWFFTFLDKSIFFIGAGIILFLVGWLMEKGRRYMIAEIES